MRQFPYLEFRFGELTTRWRRPGMRRDLLSTLYDGDAGLAGSGPCPGRSAQNRYAAQTGHSERRKMDMDRLKLEVSSWNRLRTRNLVVEPDLLGLSHEFEFEKHKAKIELPSIDCLSEDKAHGQRLSIGSRLLVDGRETPLEYYVHMVDVSILLPNELTLPTEILTRPPNAFDLFSENQRKGLDKQAERFGEIAEKVFDLWIRTLRWKCQNSAIGRPEIYGFGTGWSTYLVDESSKKRIWASPHVLTVRGYKRVTVQSWIAVGDALQKGLSPPIFWDLLFDGEEYLKMGDLQRAVVDLAVACESFMRTQVIQQLPASLNNALRDYIDQANVRQVVNHFFPEVLTAEEKKHLKRFDSVLQRLFDARNTILHSGYKEDLTLDDCERFLDVTRKLVSIRQEQPES